MGGVKPPIFRVRERARKTTKPKIECTEKRNAGTFADSWASNKRAENALRHAKFRCLFFLFV